MAKLRHRDLIKLRSYQVSFAVIQPTENAKPILIALLEVAQVKFANRKMKKSSQLVNGKIAITRKNTI